MRFPFGRGARQREIDALRQRIAELQDEITKVEESLLAESPDVETTDAYRSVQLLRESMRREELATLRQELGGLEARLERLTADRRPRASAAEIESAVEAGQGPAETSLGADGTPELEPPVVPVLTPVSGHGLPSERAIIEPPLLARSTAEEPLAPKEPEETVAAAENEQAEPLVAEAAATEAETPTAEEEEAVAEAPVVESATGPSVEESIPAATTEEPEPPAEAPVAEEPQPAAEATADQPAETVEPAAVASAVGTSLAETEDTAAEALAEAQPSEAAVDGEVVDEQPAAEAPPRRRAGAVVVALLLLLAFGAIVAVAAFEGGLIAPGAVSAPTVLPNARPTLPPTPAPTLPPPTVAPTLPPTPPPPTVPPLAAPAADETQPVLLSAAQAIEAAIDSGVIAAPVGFTGALLREDPVVSARNLQFLPNGTRVEILDGGASGSGFRWLRVRSVEGISGWVISTVLGR